MNDPRSGGLGVGSSNLPAPTNKLKGLWRFRLAAEFPKGSGQVADLAALERLPSLHPLLPPPRRPSRASLAWPHPVAMASGDVGWHCRMDGKPVGTLVVWAVPAGEPPCPFWPPGGGPTGLMLALSDGWFGALWRTKTVTRADRIAGMRRQSTVDILAAAGHCSPRRISGCVCA